MILKELLTHFNTEVSLPEYLYEESFNEVFLKGKLSKENDSYEIVVETQKDVIHSLIINANNDYPVVVSSFFQTAKRTGLNLVRKKEI